MFQRGLNKKGQKEMSIGTLLAIILGVVVLVVLILFFTGAFDRLGVLPDAVPGDLEAVAQSCRLAVQGDLITDYCYNFREVADNRYVNCEDGRIGSSLRQQNVEFENIECVPNLKENAMRDICNSARDSDVDKIIFNGNSSLDCLSVGVGVPENIAAP